jgi:hypothetical protein
VVTTLSICPARIIFPNAYHPIPYRPQRRALQSKADPYGRRCESGLVQNHIGAGPPREPQQAKSSPHLYHNQAPYKGLGADSEEKREPVGDIATAAADRLKVLDPKRSIREVDMPGARSKRRRRRNLDIHVLVVPSSLEKIRRSRAPHMRWCS